MNVPVNDLSRRMREMQPVFLDAAARVFGGNRIVLGPEVEQFEAEFAVHSQCSHAIGVANGTDALELCLRTLGVGPGGKVAVVANAGGYSTIAVNSTGANPVYVDVTPATMNMDPAALEECLSKNAIQAVIVTHLYGLAAAMPELLEVAAARGVPIIEDCAQAHGAVLNGRRVGSYGVMAAFSFYPTKNLGAQGDGGAVTTNDAGLALRVRQLRQYGWSSRYHSVLPGGRNSRLDELQAAFLRPCLRRLDAWNNRRREIADRYANLLAGLPVTLPVVKDESNVFHLYVVRTPKRDELREGLKKLGIGSDVHYPTPDHWQPMSPVRPSLPITEACCQMVLTLPCFPEMSDDEADAVAAGVRQAVQS